MREDLNVNLTIYFHGNHNRFNNILERERFQQKKKKKKKKNNNKNTIFFHIVTIIGSAFFLAIKKRL